MVLKEDDSTSAAELAAEATGRDVSEFEDLEEFGADEFYSNK